MIEIKFRAEYEGKIYEVALIDFINEFGTQVCLTGHGGIQLCVNIDLVTLMQFTGLYDADETKIYEGDVVQVYFHGSEQIDVNKTYTVVIKDMREDQFSGVGEGLGRVIGNIYENPGLIK